MPPHKIRESDGTIFYVGQLVQLENYRCLVRINHFCVGSELLRNGKLGESFVGESVDNPRNVGTFQLDEIIGT